MMKDGRKGEHSRQRQQLVQKCTIGILEKGTSFGTLCSIYLCFYIKLITIIEAQIFDNDSDYSHLTDVA